MLNSPSVDGDGVVLVADVVRLPILKAGCSWEGCVVWAAVRPASMATVGLAGEKLKVGAGKLKLVFGEAHTLQYIVLLVFTI